jgi:hypothetical protein
MNHPRSEVRNHILSTLSGLHPLLTKVSAGTLFPHHTGIFALVSVIVKKITMVEMMRPESRAAAVT